MTRSLERYQNPAVDDDVKLRLFTYNSNNAADMASIERVEVYHLDPSNVSDGNPDGRRLVETFDGSAVSSEGTGSYLLTISATNGTYVIGKYIDVWTVTAADGQPPHQIVNLFQIYPALWYSTPIPIVYDFSFRFRPNKLRKGSKQYIIIEITPNVPTAGDLRAYYENLAIVADLSISIEMDCGDCVPEERDLRMVVDCAPVDYREKRHGYYQLDTVALDMDCGIYNIWFTLNLGTNVFISDRMKFQIFD